MSDAAKPVSMHRPKDGAKALVEPWEVDLWRGYGFEIVGAKKQDEPKAKPGKG